MSEFAFPAALTSQDGLGQTIVAFDQRPGVDQPVKQANDSHPHFDEIVAGLRSGDPAVWDLFDVVSGLMGKFAHITDRVSWSGSEVLWDGDPLHSTLADQLGRAIQEGKTANYEALAKFWERLEANPNAHSREQAYDFLASHAFQITAEGLVVGFKGVVDLGDGRYRSTATSSVSGRPSGYVNGVALPERTFITQALGDVVHLPRAEVVHDPSQACRRGLHVATYNYAKSYGTVLEVHYDPAWICSVPTDGGGEKVRVWKYKAVRLADAPESYGQSTVLTESPDTAAWAGDVGYKVN